MKMIPTEPIGSIPRPLALIEAYKAFRAGEITKLELESVTDEAVRDTIQRFEATGAPVISDGEQGKFHNFASYSVEGLENPTPGGFVLSFEGGSKRPFPLLTSGPYCCTVSVDSFLETALRYAHVPVKQVVISPSFQSLFYLPATSLGIPVICSSKICCANMS